MPDNRNNNEYVVPQAAASMESFKVQVAREIGWNVANEQQLQQQIDAIKGQVAQQKGIPFNPEGYNGDLPSRLNGSIGGTIGGRIGGQMVRRMIALAEQQIAGAPSPTAVTGPATPAAAPAAPAGRRAPAPPTRPGTV